MGAPVTGQSAGQDEGRRTVRVSIVTPLYNAERFVADTITSVRGQTVGDWEMLIVDDASSDKGPEIVARLAQADPRIRLITLAQNSGAAVARNTAIRACRGRYIAFVDADDLWHGEKLERQLAFMEETGAALSFTGYEKIDLEGKRIGEIRVPARVSYHDMLKSNYIGCLTAMFDTAQLGKVEMPLIRRRQDYGLWLDILKRTAFAHGLDESLAHYRVRSDSLTSNKLTSSKFTWQLYREHQGLSVPASAYYLANFLVRAVVRKYVSERG